VADATILVVDDDAPIRRMLERTLAAEGYAVETAADGGAALARVERSVPDLIVLDVAMPGLDGLAVCRRLREKGLSLPILLLTARDAIGERVAGLDAGADDYLVKPFAAEELIARLRALLRRGREPEEVLAFADVVLDVRSGSARRDSLRTLRRCVAWMNETARPGCYPTWIDQQWGTCRDAISRLARLDERRLGRALERRPAEDVPDDARP